MIVTLGLLAEPSLGNFWSERANPHHPASSVLAASQQLFLGRKLSLLLEVPTSHPRLPRLPFLLMVIKLSNVSIDIGTTTMIVSVQLTVGTKSRFWLAQEFHLKISSEYSTEIYAQPKCKILKLTKRPNFSRPKRR